MPRQAPVQGRMTVHVARRPASRTPACDVELEYRHPVVDVRKPERRGEDHLPDSLRLHAIHAFGKDTDGGTLEWFLLTNMPLTCRGQAEKRIRDYSHRWKIERFHFVPRSGCGIGKPQARSFGRIQLLVLLHSVVAMRLLNLTYLARLDPELDADQFWSGDEQDVLYRAAHRTGTRPERRHTLSEAVRDIAALGGRRMAPSDGPPGVKALWKGMRRFHLLLVCMEHLV